MSKGIVTEMFVCPRCAADMSAEKRPSKCPHCGFKLSSSGPSELAKKFEINSSPYDQIYELVQQDMEKYLDQPANKFIPGMSEEAAEHLRISNKTRLTYFQTVRGAEMNRFFESVPIIEMESWLKSFLHFYQCLMRRGDKESIISAIEYGKQIGEISKKVEELIKLGARIYDGSKTPSSRGNESGNAKTRRK